MHLLFARFFVKAMHKMGLIDFDEPFMKLRHQGMVLDKDGVKMSKSKGNVVNPNDMVEMFGADATRMYMMFAAPLEDEIMFKQEGIKGVFRFLEKVWRLAQEKDLIDCGAGRCGDVPKEIPPVLHKTIKKVGEDIETLSFNTAIAQMMIFVNEATKHKVLPRGAFKKFLIILSPFAPHITEELWAQVGEKDSIFSQAWPEYNPEMVQDNLIEMPIQVNGKVRDKIKVSVDISEEEAEEKALASEKVQKHIEGKEIKKVIFVKGRLISVVV
jgi:leucyl-tRNA synthetase